MQKRFFRKQPKVLVKYSVVSFVWNGTNKPSWGLGFFYVVLLFAFVPPAMPITARMRFLIQQTLCKKWTV